jgi:hypothetical protein
MAVATVAFVSAPSDTPTVTLSLTDTVNAIMVNGFTLGAPTFEAAPHSIGAEYGERTVSFTVQVTGTYSTAATAMQNVSRQLLIERNWLMVDWPASAQPMFLRTYRTGQAALEWENSGANIWELPVTLVCDPFLYGPLQTVGPVTITNNPASGTNPMWYKFGAIMGDAPTGLRVTVTPSASWQDFTPLMATTAFDPSVTVTGPVFWQTNGFTFGGATATGPTGATYSGSNSVSVTPASFQPTAVLGGQRLSGVAPTTVIPGTYKVLLRVSRSDTVSTFAFNLGTLSGSTYTYPNPDVIMAQGTSTAVGFSTWVDLGEITLPFGAGNVDLADIGTITAPSISLRASHVGPAGSGTTSAYLDVFLLIPVDTAATVDSAICRTYFVGNGPGSTTSAVWDNARVPSQFRSYVSGSLTTQSPPRIDGRFMRLIPGYTNVFHLVQQTEISSSTSAVNNTDSVTATASVTFQYYPLYLHMRPDTT